MSKWNILQSKGKKKITRIPADMKKIFWTIKQVKVYESNTFIIIEESRYKEEVKVYLKYSWTLTKWLALEIDWSLNQTKHRYSELEFYSTNIKVLWRESFQSSFNKSKYKNDILELFESFQNWNKSLEDIDKDILNIIDKDKQVRLREFCSIIRSWSVYEYMNIFLWIEESIVNHLMKRWQNTLDELKENPYILLKYWLHFSYCDRIAKKIWVYNSLSPKRIEWKIFEWIRWLQNNWNSYWEYEELENTLFQWLSKQEREEASILLQSFIETNLLFVKDWKCSLTSLRIREEKIANSLLQRRWKTKYKITGKEIEWILEEKESEDLIFFEDSQINAIKEAINNKIFVITWWPGTGKTTIQDMLIKSLKLELDDEDIICIAPTWIAAKNLEWKTGHPAMTIHRALWFTPFSENPFLFNRMNPLDCKVCIIDEASMIDIELMENLLEALPLSVHIVMIWDAWQLPSVNYWQILSDILEWDAIQRKILDTWFRFWWWISHNAKLIEKWETKLNWDAWDMNHIEIKTKDWKLEKELNKLLKRYKDWDDVITDIKDLSYELEKEYEILYKEKIVEVFNNEKKIYDGNEIKVLTPFNNWFFWVEENNMLLQNLVSNNRNIFSSIEIYWKTFQVWDIVVNNKNNSWLDIMNWDIGVLEDIYEDISHWRTILCFGINFDWLEVIVRWADIKFIQHAYSLTIHKSQWSWFDCVILPIFRKNIQFYTKRLLYTGITRAKKNVITIGKKNLLTNIIKNNPERKTFLKDFLV